MPNSWIYFCLLDARQKKGEKLFLTLRNKWNVIYCLVFAVVRQERGTILVV
jgi:hypothetical protein